MRPVTPGAHCAGVGCDHDSTRDTGVAHPGPMLRGRRARGGKHTRTASSAAKGRRAA